MPQHIFSPIVFFKSPPGRSIQVFKKGKEILGCLVHEFAGQQSKGLDGKREIMERAYIMLIGFNGSVTRKKNEEFGSDMLYFLVVRGIQLKKGKREI
jgi:hypothetical protein